MSKDSQKKSIGKIVLPLVLVLLLVGSVVKGLWSVGRAQDYAPEQPLNFNHKKHAGLYKVPCLYCHAGTDKGAVGVIPSMNICMNCHVVVKTDSPKIQKLTEMYKKNMPLEWVNVHDLPDHVSFNHKRHIAKGVSCQTCHGDVEKMEVVKQVNPLNMGWCMDCHRGTTAPEHVKEAVRVHGVPNGALPGGVAPVSCYTCHQ